MLQLMHVGSIMNLIYNVKTLNASVIFCFHALINLIEMGAMHERFKASIKEDAFDGAILQLEVVSMMFVQ